ncbi:MAG: ABC transporter permease [Streptosporangiaceae bacterium]
MSGLRSLSRAMYLGFIRDRRALFFTLLFPLLFLVIFAGIFGGQTTSKSEIVQIGSVPVLDQAMRSQGLRDVLKVTRTGDRAAALAKVRKGDTTAAVEQELESGRVVIHFSRADQVKTAQVQAIMGAVVDQANLAGRRGRYEIVTEAVEDDSLKAIQFLTPGMLGWALSSAGLFGAAQTLVTWRTKGILRRLRLSPVPIWNVFAARVVVSLGVALVQTAVFFAVAVAFFGLRLTGYWWMAIPVVLAGVTTFLAIGMVVGAWAKTQDSAQSVIQLIVFPMVFLGGSFFPLDSAPQWLQTVSWIVPLRYLNDGMLNVVGRGLGPMSVLPDIGVLLGIAAVASLIAIRLFRWDDKNLG